MHSPGETALHPSPAGTIHSVFFNDRGLRAGWRLLIFAAILLVSGYASLASLGLVSSSVQARLGPGAATSPPWLGLVEVAQFLPVVLASWIMSKMERRKAGVYGLPLTRSAMSRLAAGFGAWGFLPLTLVLLIMHGLGVFYFGDVAVGGAQALYWAGAWGLVFLFVGLLEEYAFRGYALYTLADGIGFWPAAIVSAVTFAYLHMGNGGESRIGIAGVFLYAIFAAATLRRTGNLWLAVGAHAGWDWGQSFFYGVSDSGTPVFGHLFNPRIHGPDWLSGGSVGPEGSIVTLIFWALITIGFLVLYPDRREAIRA
jgi:membrane protease YdiL (CAAX protease family)